jgi:hypothetical protein
MHRLRGRVEGADDMHFVRSGRDVDVITQHAQFPGSPNMIFTYILGRSAHATVS